ncbi:uncharacterized protein ACRADG_009533 [Cochliomyia hominivorax]
MYFVQQLEFFIILIVSCRNLVKSEPDWTFDFVSINVINQTPDITFVDLYVTRPSRGVFAMSGVVDIKEDLTDDLLLGVTVLYSMTGGSDFIKSPFNVPESNLTIILNKFYKDIVMESISDCSEEAPTTDDHFVAPLTKRKVTFDNCIISNENMPSKLRKGFYKIIFKYRKQSEGSLEFIVNVENKF